MDIGKIVSQLPLQKRKYELVVEPTHVDDSTFHCSFTWGSDTPIYLGYAELDIADSVGISYFYPLVSFEDDLKKKGLGVISYANMLESYLKHTSRPYAEQIPISFQTHVSDDLLAMLSRIQAHTQGETVHEHIRKCQRWFYQRIFD